MSVIAQIISIILVGLVFSLIEVSIALLLGYRNKIFLTGILVLNVIVAVPLEWYLIAQTEGVLIMDLLGFLLGIILLEGIMLFSIYRKRYTFKELALLLPVMNVTSFIIVLLLREFVL